MPKKIKYKSKKYNNSPEQMLAVLFEEWFVHVNRDLNEVPVYRLNGTWDELIDEAMKIIDRDIPSP